MGHQARGVWLGDGRRQKSLVACRLSGQRTLSASVPDLWGFLEVPLYALTFSAKQFAFDAIEKFFELQLLKGQRPASSVH